MRKTTRVRFDVDMDEHVHDGYQINDVTSTVQVQTHEENVMMERSRKPQTSSKIANGQYPHKYSPPLQTIGNGYSSQSNEIEMKYIAMVNGLKDELSFLEESNSNLLVELRESQDANYILTEELRRIQRSNINTLDELQACQTANTVLRHELQRLEQNSVRMAREAEKYKKANKLLREEIREIKSSQLKRKNSIQMVREKAKDLQQELFEKEKKHQELSSLRHSINIIVDTVESDNFNIDTGYCPTDSDTLSTEGNDESLDAFTPKAVRKDKNLPQFPAPISRKLLPRQPMTPDYKQEQNGLFGRRHKELNSEFDERRGRSKSLNFNKTNGTDDEFMHTSGEVRVLGRKRGSIEGIDKSDRFVDKKIDLHKDVLTQNAGKAESDSLSHQEKQYSRSNLTLDLNGNFDVKQSVAMDIL